MVTAGTAVRRRTGGPSPCGGCPQCAQAKQTFAVEGAQIFGAPRRMRTRSGASSASTALQPPPPASPRPHRVFCGRRRAGLAGREVVKADLAGHLSARAHTRGTLLELRRGKGVMWRRGASQDGGAVLRAGGGVAACSGGGGEAFSAGAGRAAGRQRSTTPAEPHGTHQPSRARASRQGCGASACPRALAGRGHLLAGRRDT